MTTILQTAPTRSSIQEPTVECGNRRYIFSQHGVSPERARIAALIEYLEQQRQQRRSRQGRRQTPYSVRTPDRFDLEQFANHNRLKACCDIIRADGGKAPGVDGVRFKELTDAEVFSVMRELGEGLKRRHYLPREYRIIDTPKPHGGFRRLSLACEPDKAVFKALQVCLDGFWRNHLPRVGQSHHEILRRIANAIEGGDYFLTQDDIRKNFDNIRIEDVMRFHHQYISQPELLWLIEKCVRGNDCHRQTGLPQGNAYSPIANEVVLTPGLDSRLDADRRIHAVKERYIDNLFGLTATAQEGQFLRECWEENLSPLALELKGQDGPTFDVREPNESLVLGLLIHCRNRRVHFTLPESYFSSLVDKLNEHWLHPDPVHQARVVVTGQFNAYSMVFTEQAEKERVVSRVLDCLVRCSVYGLSTDWLMQVADTAAERWRRFYDAS